MTMTVSTKLAKFVVSTQAETPEEQAAKGARMNSYARDAANGNLLNTGRENVEGGLFE